MNNTCPTCNGTKVLKAHIEGTEISSNISVPCPHCVGVAEFLEGVIDGGEYVRETPINRHIEKEA